MRYLTATITALLFSFGLAAPAQAHDTDTPECVTTEEFKTVEDGDIRFLVDRDVLGNEAGTLVNYWRNNGHNFAKKHYVSCSGNRQFRILYKDKRVWSHEWLYRAVDLPPCGC